MTSGASISSRIEYPPGSGIPVSRGGGAFPEVLSWQGRSLSFRCPPSTFPILTPGDNDDYNGTFQITSGHGRVPALSAELRARVKGEHSPQKRGSSGQLEGYGSGRPERLGNHHQRNGMGFPERSLTASSDDPGRRPMIRGKISIDQG